MEQNSAKNRSLRNLHSLSDHSDGLHFTVSSFLFRGMVRNGIPRFCFYFCSTKRNSELFSLPLESSEWNSESLLLFRFHRTDFRVVFSSAEGFGRESLEFASIFCSTERNSELFSLPRKGSERNSVSFLFRGTAGIPPEIIICSVYSVFRGIIFCRKFPTDSAKPNFFLTLSCLWIYLSSFLIFLCLFLSFCLSQFHPSVSVAAVSLCVSFCVISVWQPQGVLCKWKEHRGRRRPKQ